MILQTQRLLLREFDLADAQSLYRLNADPDVIRFTGDAPFATVADAEKFVSGYADYRTNGYGRWAMIEKTNGEFIGWCGLKFNCDINENDVGFRLFASHWNKGFATEAAKACVDYGFDQLGMQSIIGRAMADNKASIKVLEKIGMHFERPFDFHGGPGVIYRINTNKLTDSVGK